eukprot:6203562-Pleurochrysis_carterae.AAC.3
MCVREAGGGESLTEERAWNEEEQERASESGRRETELPEEQEQEVKRQQSTQTEGKCAFAQATSTR